MRRPVNRFGGRLGGFSFGGSSGSGDAKKIAEKAMKAQVQAAKISAKGQVAAAQLNKEAAQVPEEAKKQWTLPMTIGAIALAVIGGGVLLLLAQRMARR